VTSTGNLGRLRYRNTPFRRDAFAAGAVDSMSQRCITRNIVHAVMRGERRRLLHPPHQIRRSRKPERTTGTPSIGAGTVDTVSAWFPMSMEGHRSTRSPTTVTAERFMHVMAQNRKAVEPG
jgi:hypothetical protein